jgi:bisphosphoglycerate-dependent phosphoglycerate mutase
MEIQLEHYVNIYLELDENQISKLEIPTGNPLLII